MAPRTKGCAICRKKRIKCDATLPHCLMCIRTGRDCPGPLNGPLFVDMTSTAGQGMKKRKAKLPSEEIVLNWQVSQRNMMNELFYANFLAYFTSDGEGKDIQNRMTWLHRLPVLSTDGTNNALTLALYATAAAYCAVETANTALVQDACRIYGEALRTHSRLIHSKQKDVTVHMVSTSVMLSLFEAMRATTADAYRSHINGAAKMIEVTGPGECLEGILCQLFFHIRTQMAFVYLTTEKNESTVSVKKILLESLAYRRLPTFQRLMNHISTLAEIYVKKTSPESKQQLIDFSVYSSVKAEVDALWNEYNEAAERKGEKIVWKNQKTGKMDYRDCFTALCLAYFSSARILFTILAPRLAVSFIDLTDHYGAILDVARHLCIHKIGCAYMRMATPLYLVAMHALRPEQRAQAIGIFEDWKRGSMAGISALALETIRERQDMELNWGLHMDNEELGLSGGEVVNFEEIRRPQSLAEFDLDDWVGHI